MSWHPLSLPVGLGGTNSTFQIVNKCYKPNDTFTYAEFGVYQGSTALKIASEFPNSKIYLFDYQDTLKKIESKFSLFGDRIHFHGNTDKFLDSYNWSLSELLRTTPGLKFDYVLIDGAHTFAVDALTFFMCDKMLNSGGYIDFNDHHWRLRGSSLDPLRIPQTAAQYTDEQIDDQQVKRVINLLVRTNSDYQEVEENKVFRKSKIVGSESVLSTESTMSDEEIGFLLKFLTRSSNYLEFGSGFSTFQAAKLVSKRVVSVESSLEYRNWMSQKIQDITKMASIEIIHTDIGDTGLWGYPSSDHTPEKWSNYLNWLPNDSGAFKPDTILIDGRFRVATFVDVFLRFPGAIVLFDDYYDRPHYSSVEKLINPRNRCGRIAEFKIPRIRKNKLIQTAVEMQKTYKFDPR